MTLKDLNPGTCMALPRKIPWEIEYTFPAVGLYSNYHQEDKITQWKCRRLLSEKQAQSFASFNVKNQ